MPEFQRPSNQKELESREAKGFWKAITFVNELSRDKNSAIDLATIRQIHRTIFDDANPDIAGVFRVAGEDHKKLHHITPPPGSAVAGLMADFSTELDARVASLPPQPKTKKPDTFRKWVKKVVTFSA